MRYQTLTLLTMPHGDGIATVHQGNVDCPVGSIVHLNLKFESYSAADMVRRIIQSEGATKFIANNFLLQEGDQVVTTMDAIIKEKMKDIDFEEREPGPKRKKKKEKLEEEEES